MTLSPPPTVWDNPLDIISFVRTQSAALRHSFGELTMRNKLNPQEDVALSPPVWATYHALSTSTFMPEFHEIRRLFSLQHLELYWIFGLNFKTPGHLFATLPVGENLVIPLSELPDIRAILALKALN